MLEPIKLDGLEELLEELLEDLLKEQKKLKMINKKIDKINDMEIRTETIKDRMRIKILILEIQRESKLKEIEKIKTEIEQLKIEIKEQIG